MGYKTPFMVIRQRYGVFLEHLFLETPAQVSDEAVRRLDLYGEAEPFVLAECVQALVRLTGREITLEEIEYVPIMTKDGGTKPSVHTDAPLSEKPGMQEIQDYYFFNVRSLLDLSGVDIQSYTRMLAKRPASKVDVVRVLRVISDFANVEYTLENVDVVIAVEEEKEGEEGKDSELC